MRRLLRKGVATALVATLVGFGACDSDRVAKPNPLSAARVADPGRDADPALRGLDHIIVIYLENRSFDNVYGEFAGANGLAAATDAPLQVDASTPLPQRLYLDDLHEVSSRDGTGRAERHACHHVTDMVHAQRDARMGHDTGERQSKRRREGVGQDNRHGDRCSRRGVTRGERMGIGEVDERERPPHGVARPRTGHGALQ